jgi:hypothetical protein
MNGLEVAYGVGAAVAVCAEMVLLKNEPGIAIVIAAGMIAAGCYFNSVEMMVGALVGVATGFTVEEVTKRFTKKGGK